MNTDINKELKTIVSNLKILNNKNLNKIYLEINFGDRIEITNLESGEKIEKNNILRNHLIIKMNFKTFIDLKDNKKNPEDLLFEEKIKISGDIKLLK
ncbi:MAG: SCP2 sterol-binding domain-containing protein [Actinomycetota bacterium]|nr:SCP2 sterol-binding domain-containing protein [Actinomycetota bacterium]